MASPTINPLTEDQFRNAWLLALSRLCRVHGDAKVALWLGVSLRHLRNLRSGASMPTADKIWNLLAHDDSAHDEMDAEFGQRNVPKDAICVSDPLTLAMISLAHVVADAESPESHGGTAVTDHEIMKMDESLVRKVNRVTGTWLDRLAKLRKPTVRSVA